MWERVVGVWELGPVLSVLRAKGLALTHTTLSSSFWGLPYRILNINQKKELLRGLWVVIRSTIFILSITIVIYSNKASLRRLRKAWHLLNLNL